MAGQICVPPGDTQGFVRVPRWVRDAGLSATALTVFVLILAMWQGKAFKCSQATLQRQLGRSGRTDAIRRAINEAKDIGLLGVTRTKGVRRTSVLAVLGIARPDMLMDEDFDVVPRVLLRTLEDKRINPEALQVWLYVDQALGTRVHMTTDTPAELGARIGRKGLSEKTIRAHVRALAAVGVVVIAEEQCQETGSWRLERPRAAAPVAVPEEQPPAPRPEPSRPADVEPKYASSARKDLRGRKPLRAPEDLAPEPPSVASATVRPVGDARARSTGGLRPKWRGLWSWRSGAISRPDVLDVLQRLDPEDWCTGPARRYLPGLGRIVAEALDAGVPAEAIVLALETYADQDLFGGRHLPAARQGLRTLATDVRYRLACHDCGRGDDVRGGLCPAHRTDGPDDVVEGGGTSGAEAAATVPARARAYAEQGLSVADVELLDPAAAAWIHAKLALAGVA